MGGATEDSEDIENLLVRANGSFGHFHRQEKVSVTVAVRIALHTAAGSLAPRDLS